MNEKAKEIHSQAFIPVKWQSIGAVSVCASGAGPLLFSRANGEGPRGATGPVVNKLLFNGDAKYGIFYYPEKVGLIIMITVLMGRRGGEILTPDTEEAAREAVIEKGGFNRLYNC